MVVLWSVLVVAGVAAMAAASRRAVDAALVVVHRLGWSPAVVGLTVLAIGTDLPEITNSIVATATGHGDVNVGDSMGSVITQLTLVLGILCLAGALLDQDRGVVIAIGTATSFAVLLVWVLLTDGQLSHVDGLVLLIAWAGGTAMLSRGYAPSMPERRRPAREATGSIVSILFWLAIVGAASFVTLEAFLRLIDGFGVPEFVASFVALSIGTSLPELAVDLTALRRGATTMAIGEVFGSSFVDATLSIGIGPALFSATVSTDALPAIAAVGVGVVATTLLTATTEQRSWRLAVALFAIYAGVYAVALA